MRNLQKILALVLALVMSLSLMATAGATDFSDDAEIDETFRESVDVLNGLKVFQGYDNGAYFSPKGDITRAEVAAIIYRIATGDVSDSQVKIYADYNKFSDVPSDHWAAGYINYCTNAEYIKGRGDGKFYPSDKVTGYEALAMILRVVGYDKNGEFTGADWQVQTAATANQRKVTKNVNAGTLGTPASRETVAELLCQAILIEKVNYTLAFGYQISTDPKDTIAYETFQMERLTGVVTGNEIADLKETSPMAAGQTRMVIDGEERVLNVVSGLEDIGKSVRMYVRPQSGTTRYDMVTDDVYATELNKVYDSFASVSSVGNSTASSEGITSITSIAGAEHYINYDYVTRWTARMRITYVMDLKWTEYQAFSMRKDNGGKLYAYRPADMANPGNEVSFGDDRSQWNTRLPHDGYTFTYVKTIALDDELTSQDWENLKTLFTNADKTGTSIVMGEVYVGTASFNNAQKDVSDEIRWEDFVATYLKNEETRQQVESNRLGDRLIIVDNDNDGIAEYVLQTRYTIAKVVPNGSKLTLGAVESKFDDTNDRVNIITASDELVSVSGKELAASEEALATGDVVIYALIDGNIRAQKAETETARITAINRGTTTVTYEGGEKKQSGVHPHAEGLTSGVAKMVIGTNYTMYFDLDGNLAAFTEGNVGSFVLLTDGWYNQAVNAREYAVQAYIDGRLQTVNVTNNGSYFIGQQQNNNNWSNLKQSFGNGSINSTGTNGNNVQTIVANLEDGNLIPVDKSYRYSQRVVMLDMVNNVIPTRDSNAKGDVYTTDYAQDTAYQVPNNTGDRFNTVKQTGVEVLGRADTVYYYVHNLGDDNNPTNLNGQKNYVVRTYTGYNNIPAIDPSYIEDVYAVGIQAGQTTSTDTNKLYYTAEVVVVELNSKYIDSRTASEQVFIPATGFVSGNIAGAGIETVNMIRGNGEVEEGVLVDMRQSRVDGYRAYDEADNSLKTSTIYAGLYYMDPVGTNADGKVIYKIENMKREAIRSNNYLAGYVSQTNVTNDHVRVDGMTVNNARSDFHDVPTHNEIVGDAIVDLQGATITSGSKLYKLGYSSSGVPDLNGNLSAAEVFYRNPDPNVTSTSECHLNELWNEVPGAGALFSGAANRVPRNEVLVRYDDNGNVIWAISFREFRSVNSSNVGTRDLAQTVWYNMLPAKDQVTTPTKFMNVAENAEGDLTPAGTDNTITITHAKANEWTGKIVDVTSLSGSVVNYKLERWNAARNNWELVPRTDADELQEAANLRANTGRAVYQLTIDLNQGTPIVYTLIKLAEVNQWGKLVSNDLDNVLVARPSAGTTCDYDITVRNPAGFSIDTLFLSKISAEDGTQIVGYKAYDNNGIIEGRELRTNQGSDTARYFVITLRNSAGEETTVTAYRVDDPSVGGSWPVAVTTSGTTPITVYDTYTPGTATGTLNTNGQVSGSSVWFVAAGQGTFSVTTGGTTTNNLGTYDSIHDVTYYNATSVTSKISATFVPVEPIDAQITDVKLNPNKVLLGWTIDTSTLASGSVTISLPKGATLPTSADATLAKLEDWVGQPGAQVGNFAGIVHNNPSGAAANNADMTIAAVAGSANSFDVTVAGVYGGEDATVRINFVESAKKAYQAHVWSASTSGNLNVTLRDLGTNQWLTKDEMDALNIGTNTFTFTVGGQTFTTEYLRTEVTAGGDASAIIGGAAGLIADNGAAKSLAKFGTTPNLSNINATYELSQNAGGSNTFSIVSNDENIAIMFYSADIAIPA